MLPDTVIKWGCKIRPAEEASMRLVQKYAPSMPIPELQHATYKYSSDGSAFYGELFMSYIPGKTLKDAWASYDDSTKQRICQDTWDMVATIRTIPRPAHLVGDVDNPHRYYCTVDGTPSRSPFFGDNTDVAPIFLDDQTLRDRIYARYVAHSGLSYLDSAEYLPDRIPHSDTAVFTHGYIAPHNIVVDDQGRILALLDWESSGWFPDWWEYSQMMGMCDKLEYDWQHCMERTRPVPWDVAAIRKARRVLF